MQSFRTFAAEFRAGTLGANSRKLWQFVQSRLAVYLAILISLTFAYVVLVYAIPMAMGKHEGAQPIPGERELNFAILALHVATAIPPLLIGLIGFSKRARRFSMKLHRWIGTTYCVCIWISAATGVALAYANTAGLASRLGFSTLGILWFVTTYFAYVNAKRRDIVSHRVWMIRSFALTLAVVTVRPIMMVPGLVEVDLALHNNIASWACWIPNILIAEYYIRRTNHRGMLVPPVHRSVDRAAALQTD